MSVLAVLTAILPQLQFLIEHGKTVTNHDGKWYRRPKGNGSIWEYLVSSLQDMSVRKSWFIHFYLVSILVCIVLIASMCKHATYFSVMDVVGSPHGNKLVVLSLFGLHSLRRLYECVFVFKFGASRMHLAGYVVGVVYYVAVPLTLWHEAGDGAFPQWKVRTLCGLSLFFCGNLLQSYFHRVLSGSSGNAVDSVVVEKENGKRRYIFPRGFGFDHVSCPHYSAEIVLYIGLICLIPNSPAILALFVWVVINLSVVAGKSHSWYEITFPEQMNKRRHRKRLIPLVY